jgi:hypothetical protein
MYMDIMRSYDRNKTKYLWAKYLIYSMLWINLE